MCYDIVTKHTTFNLFVNLEFFLAWNWFCTEQHEIYTCARTCNKHVLMPINIWIKWLKKKVGNNESTKHKIHSNHEIMWHDCKVYKILIYMENREWWNEAKTIITNKLIVNWISFSIFFLLNSVRRHWDKLNRKKNTIANWLFISNGACHCSYNLVFASYKNGI